MTTKKLDYYEFWDFAGSFVDEDMDGAETTQEIIWNMEEQGYEVQANIDEDNPINSTFIVTEPDIMEGLPYAE